MRLGSGGSGTTEWDNVSVATRWDDLRPRPRIPNPSFEAGPTPAAPGYTDSIPGWQEGGAMGRTGVNPSAGGSPFANNGTIPDGNRVAFIQSTGGDLSSLSTTITGLQPDTQYRVTFRANSRESHSLPLPAWSLDGGDFVGFDADPVGGANAYRPVEGTFVSTATTASLVIVNQTDPGTDSTVLIDDFTIEADVFLTTENNGALTITGYDRNGDGTEECPVGELAIPDSIGGLPVTAIGAQAFRFCRDLTAVTLPDGLTSIGIQAFLGCNGLTSVNLPDGLTSIGDGAFATCDMLTAIEVAVGNANYSSLDGVLYNVDKTTLIQFPGGRTGAFSVPPSVASIGRLAFDGCSGLTSVTLPDGLTSIGRSAFARCSGLTALTLPDGLTSIESSTFFDCSGLRSVTLPDSLTSIGSSAFAGCSGLTWLTLPDGLTSIGGSTFQRCTGLTSLTLPAGLTSIGEAAFINCSALTAVYFLGDAPLLGGDVTLFGGVGPNAMIYYVPETGGWPAPGGIFGAGDFGGGLPTALWDPAGRITSIVLNPTTIDLTWLPFQPVASPSYRVESSPDGQTWTTVPGFGDVTGATATITRPPSTARLLLRVVGNGG